MRVELTAELRRLDVDETDDKLDESSFEKLSNADSGNVTVAHGRVSTPRQILKNDDHAVSSRSTDDSPTPDTGRIQPEPAKNTWN